MPIKLSVLILIALFLSSAIYAVESDWNQSYTQYSGDLNIKVYHNVSCNCCRRWMNYLKTNNFNVSDMPTSNLSYVNEQLSLPPKLKSSHTAIIEGYIIEGHVPAEDIKRLLTEKPDIRGLAVPRMPDGAPGAEKGDFKQNFVVFQFDKKGEYSVFTSYQLDKHNHYQPNIPER